jgi:hypothetical protein
MNQDSFRSFCLLGLLAVASPAAVAGTSLPEPVLQLTGDDFPDLIVYQPAYDESGVVRPLACDQIRGKRLDELDPLWKQAVDRIHVDCDDLREDEAGFNMIASEITGFLKPGTVQFAGLPVVEVRLMDSELWSDHQYILAQPFAQARDMLRRFVEARCLAPREASEALASHRCAVTEDEQGLYLESSEIGGIWVHADPDDAHRTVYAEAWSD